MKALTLTIALILSASSTFASVCNDHPEVSPEAIAAARNFLAANSGHFRNRETIAVVDYSKVSTVPRLFLIDLTTGASQAFLVAHGRASDIGGNCAGRFSNKYMSNMSSLGALRTIGTYHGRSGFSVRLHGMEETNSNYLTRALSLHGSSYVKPGQAPGRTVGGLAMTETDARTVISALGKDALIYVWAPSK